MDEEFAVAFRSEERGGDDIAATDPQVLSVGYDALEHLAVDRRVPHHAMVGAALAGLELGLDERDDGATWFERGRDRPEDLARAR